MGVRAGWVVAALTALTLAGCAAPEPPTKTVVVREVPPPTATVEGLIERHRLSGATVGFMLEDVDTGRPLISRMPETGFIPASTAKLATYLAALHILGPEHRFETTVRGSGAIEDGTLAGDLVLVGGGDPFLRAHGLLDLVRQLRRAGLHRVTGRFLVDGTGLPAGRHIHPDQPETADYNPGYGALAYDFNRVQRRWQATARPGTVTTWAVAPFAMALPGERPTGDEDWQPVEDPAGHAARVFKAIAAMQGIDLPDPVPGKPAAGARTLARHRSLPLARIAALGLEFSNNLAAELVGTAAATRLAGRQPSLAASAGMLAGWWRRTLPEIDWTGWHIANHSGLDQGARVRPSQLAAVARFAATRLAGTTDPLTLLPASGVDEALRGRLTTPDAALRVWAKSGTMSYGSGLAGILMTQGGRRLAFALLVSDFDRRRAYDAAIGTAAESDAVSAAEDWIDRAKAFEGELVRQWIDRF